MTEGIICNKCNKSITWKDCKCGEDNKSKEVNLKRKITFAHYLHLQSNIIGALMNSPIQRKNVYESARVIVDAFLKHNNVEVMDWVDEYENK